MNPFAIARPRSYDDAAKLLADGSYSLPVLKAGGMDVVDHLKEGLVEPDLLVDVRRLGDRAGGGIKAENGRLRMEASTVLADLADSALIREKAPALRQSAEVIPLDENGNLNPRDPERPDVNDLLTKGIDPQIETALLILNARALASEAIKHARRGS